jgi:hypothetical protein
LAWFITFQFVCIAWIFFKAKDMATAKAMFSQIKKQFAIDKFGAFWQHYYLVIVMIVLGLLIQFIPEKFTKKAQQQLQQEGVLGYLFIFFIFVFIYAFLKVDIQPIYLQF